MGAHRDQRGTVYVVHESSDELVSMRQVVPHDGKKLFVFIQPTASTQSDLRQGLHRLDDPNAEFEMAPTLAPPKDWTELEGKGQGKHARTHGRDNAY